MFNARNQTTKAVLKFGIGVSAILATGAALFCVLSFLAATGFALPDSAARDWIFYHLHAWATVFAAGAVVTVFCAALIGMRWRGC